MTREDMQAVLSSWDTDHAFLPSGSSDHEVRLADALRQLLNETEWRPIETAPKDGRRIVVGRDMGNFGWIKGVAYWADVKGISGWVPLLGFCEISGVLGLGGPTHWMPIPAGPQPQGTPEVHSAGNRSQTPESKVVPGAGVELTPSVDNT